MLELVVIGPESNQRWRRRLVEGRNIRLGRAPRHGWAIPWDRRISREHADLLLDGQRLFVRCLPSALNAANLDGRKLTEFSIVSGEEFRIGVTTFRLRAVSDDAPYDDLPAPTPDASAADEPTMVQGSFGQDIAARAEIEALREQVDALNKVVQSGAGSVGSAGQAAAEEAETEQPAENEETSSLPAPPAKKKDSTFDPDLESFARKSWVQALRAKLAGTDSAEGQPSASRPSGATPSDRAGWGDSDAQLADADEAVARARRLIWGRLPNAARDDIRRIASGASPDDAAKERIVADLNQLVRDRDFLVAAGIAELLDEQSMSADVEPFVGAGADKYENLTDLQLRLVGRNLLQMLFPIGLGQWEWDAGRPHALGVLSRGDTVGVRELLLNLASHLTYVAGGGSTDDDDTIAAPVELVCVTSEMFLQLVGVSEQFRSAVGRLSQHPG